tara:strand:+ start:151 stop:1275 length:1125 start_codon:yes stop_codon:yes gene_type:complete
MLKYINGEPSATNHYKNLYWEGYFTQEISWVIDKIQTNDIGSIRGQYSFLYVDKTVTPGVSYNLGYPLYTNGIDYSNDPLDLNAKINIDKLKDLVSCIADNFTVPFDPAYYNCFDNCSMIQTTEILKLETQTLEKLKEDFLRTVEINTRNKSIAIMFGDGWESYALYNACKILGRDVTLVNIKSRTPTRVQSLAKFVLLDTVTKDIHDLSFHNTRNFSIKHRYMTGTPLDFDVILKGNDAEIFQGSSDLWNSGYKNVKSIITTCTTRNSILELNTNNTWIDPFTNLDYTASVLSGDTQLKNRSLQKELCTDHSIVISDDAKISTIFPNIVEKVFLQNIKYLQDLGLSNSIIKSLSRAEFGFWAQTFAKILNRYV